MQQNNDLYAIRSRAEMILALRPHSVSELALKLRRKFPGKESEIETTLDRLKELEYLNDVKFAASYAGSLQKRKGLGVSGIRQKLRMKGLDTDTIAQALLPLYEMEEESLRVAFEKKLSQIPETLGKQEKMRKLFDYLKRKGFSSQDILHLVQSEL